MTPWHHLIAAASAFGLGAVVGSFLNVCIWRIPRGESVLRPPSRCPRCRARLSCRDNVPLLGWLMLRARCRTCSAPISARYPAVEALAGLAFVAAYALGLAIGPVDPTDAPLRSFAWFVANCVPISGLIVVGFIAFDAGRSARVRDPGRAAGRTHGPHIRVGE